MITVRDKQFEIPSLGSWRFSQDEDMVVLLSSMPLISGLLSQRLDPVDIISTFQNSGKLDDLLCILFVPVGEKYKSGAPWRTEYLQDLKDELTNDAFEEALEVFFQSAKKSKLAGFLSRLKSSKASTSQSQTGDQSGTPSA